MGLVTEVDDAAAPTVLIVDNNPMSSLRLSNLFKTRNFNVELCEDGDQAVDEYIRLDPELVVLSLDIPSLDGHPPPWRCVARWRSRIVFIAPARMADTARNAAYSAGAVRGCRSRFPEKAWKPLGPPFWARFPRPWS